VKWYQDGGVHRLQQPLGKQYSYGKGPLQEDLDEGIAHNNPQAVKEKGVIMSMSRKGTPADNAIIEMFHPSLKCETFYLERFERQMTLSFKPFKHTSTTIIIREFWQS